jgi:hypothetical protein
LVETAALPEGVTVAGLKLQETPAGNPVQAKVTAELKPLAGATLRVAAEGANLESVREPGSTETEKSAGGGGLTVTVTALDVESVKLLSPL